MKIRWVHPRRCLIRQPIRAGEARATRGPTSAGGRLFGFSIGCPACGFRSVWRHPEDVRFTEGELVDDEELLELPGDREELRAFRRPATLDADRPLTCPACKRAITIAGESIAAP